MNIITSNEQNVIERDIHCPYCDSDKALLISGLTDKRTILQLPDYGSRYWLSVFFTCGMHLLVHGIPMIEKKRVYEYTTYGFCPHCGKTYNAGVPAKISKEKVHKLYRSSKNKVMLGLCSGIAEYTGLSVMLVRIMMIVYGLAIIPAFAYFVLGGLDIIPMNPKENKENND